MERTLWELVLILVLGIGGQWLAWRLGLPAIMVLLIVGILAGPATGIINPDRLFGLLLFPVIALCVAVILFEGGLRLQIGEWKTAARPIRNLVTVGVLVTGVLTVIVAHVMLGLPYRVALVLGAILVVTGPTVIIPLLEEVRPVSRVNSVLKWEGIIIDPVGAMLAVVVFNIVQSRGGPAHATVVVALVTVAKILLAGGLLGSGGAGLIILMLRRFWIPDLLQNAVALMVLVAVFALADTLQSQAGLVAVITMGIVLANQRIVPVRHVLAFKENLRVLVLSALFILLGSRLRPDELVASLNLSAFLFLAVVIVVIRPASVFLATLGTDLSWRERLFVALVAPRGVVAASISSLFAIRMAHAGLSGGEGLVPVTFLVIIGTVAFYGLTMAPVGRWLGLAKPNPQGVLFVGAHAWARAMARALREEGSAILLVDDVSSNVRAAKAEGLPALRASILSEYIVRELDLSGLGYFLALTANDEVNALAAVHFSRAFERSHIFQLFPTDERDGRDERVSFELRGQYLFGPGINFETLSERFARNAIIRKVRLDNPADFERFVGSRRPAVTPLFLVAGTGELTIVTAGAVLRPSVGQTVICLMDPDVEGRS